MDNSPSLILWRDIYFIVEKTCKKFSLSLKNIQPASKRFKDFGITYTCEKCSNSDHINEANCQEKTIHLRIHQIKNKNKPLAASTILKTLAHELAHLKVWNHVPEHKELEIKIKEYIQELGYFL